MIHNHPYFFWWSVFYASFCFRKVFVDIMLRRMVKYETENKHPKLVECYYKDWRAYLLLNTWTDFRKLRKKSYTLEAL